jgi:MFS transporter, OFA family, oxalate/formate antiporter
MRYAILLAAVLMQMCLGATYSWSVFVQPLRALTGLQQGPVQIPFTVFYFIFPLTMMIAGTLLPRIGPRVSAMAGGLCFGGGWLLAGQGDQSFIFTTLGIGLLAGIGAGMAYIVPITVCIRWFPNSKGLVTGIAVAGFGGGAALVSKLGGWLMATAGRTPFETFTIFGLIFAVVVVTAGTFMHFPRQRPTDRARHPARIVEILGHPAFFLLYGAMFFGLAAGFAVNANLKELYRGTGNTFEIGITAVSLFALANATGRIVWGLVFDRVRSATAIQANLLLQAAVLFAAPAMLSSSWGFWAVALLTGFNYGGVLVIYVSTTSRCWGADRVGQVYSWLFSSNIPAALSPILAGMTFDRSHSFTPALYTLAGMLLCCAVVTCRRAAMVNGQERARTF